MKLVSKCRCGCLIQLDQADNFLADASGAIAPEIEKKFALWLDDHRDCWRSHGWPLWATILIASVLGSIAARLLP